jgi:hypothetical protein
MTNVFHDLIRFTSLALGACLCLTSAHADPYACLQVGEVKAFPPVIPEAFRIHECSSFTGQDAASMGKKWCDHASQVVLGPKDVPPVVKVVDSCPTGALALCEAPFPDTTLTVKRYYYVADAGSGGIEGLRKTCEAHKAGHPKGVFTKF